MKHSTSPLAKKVHVAFREGAPFVIRCRPGQPARIRFAPVRTREL